jgi:hypothetical protein
LAISKRPKLLRISEEMRQWSGILEREVRSWPRVTSRPMFGLIGFYHNSVIFAALPRTRALSTPESFILKFDLMPPALVRCARKDPRISSERQTSDVKWYSFKFDSADDMRDGLVAQPCIRGGEIRIRIQTFGSGKVRRADEVGKVCAHTRILINDSWPQIYWTAWLPFRCNCSIGT